MAALLAVDIAEIHHAGFLWPQRPSADAGDVDVADSSVAPRAGDEAPAAPSRQKSEIHTAIQEYLAAAAQNRTPDFSLFKQACFNNMMHHNALTTKQAAALLQVVIRGMPKIAIHQRHTFHLVSNACVHQGSAVHFNR